MARRLLKISEEEALSLFARALELETSEVFFGDITFEIAGLKQILADGGFIVDTTDELAALFEKAAQELNGKNPNFHIRTAVLPGERDIALFLNLINLSRP